MIDHAQHCVATSETRGMICPESPGSHHSARQDVAGLTRPDQMTFLTIEQAVQLRVAFLTLDVARVLSR
jgi:hypothetical protein